MGKRYLMLTAVLLVGVGLDQWTKLWADRSLGTIEHPVPVAVTPEDTGLPLGELLQRKLGLDDVELEAVADRGLAGVVLLHREAKPAPADRAFPDFDGRPRLTYWWAFHHRTLDLPPRRLPQAQHQARDLEEHGLEPLRKYLVTALPYLDDEARSRVVEDFVYPVVHAPLPLSRLVEPGQVYLVLHRPVHVVDGFLQLKYAENPGAAWGFLSNQSELFRKWFFLIVSLLAVGVITSMIFRLRDDQLLPAWGFAIILSGAIGNLIDRVRFNFVIDFIDMYVGDSHWPTYNIADVAITVGVALLLLEVVIRKDQAFLAGAPRDTDEEAAAA